MTWVATASCTRNGPWWKLGSLACASGQFDLGYAQLLPLGDELTVIGVAVPGCYFGCYSGYELLGDC
jgi:hypothetical protein